MVCTDRCVNAPLKTRVCSQANYIYDISAGLTTQAANIKAATNDDKMTTIMTFHLTESYISCIAAMCKKNAHYPAYKSTYFTS